MSQKFLAFSEHFRYINNADPMKAKTVDKGVDQLMEGVKKLFNEMNNRKLLNCWSIQYEVIQYRLEHEYGAKNVYENFPVHKACWVKPDDDAMKNSKNLNVSNKNFSEGQNTTVFSLIPILQFR
jgi:peptide chain release factor 3